MVGGAITWVGTVLTVSVVPQLLTYSSDDVVLHRRGSSATSAGEAESAMDTGAAGEATPLVQDTSSGYGTRAKHASGLADT